MYLWMQEYVRVVIAAMQQGGTPGVLPIWSDRYTYTHSKMW